MLQWLKTRTNRTATARQLYGSCVAAARNPVFYRDWCVADSLEGRFEMVMLHVGLLVRRLTEEGEPGKALGQSLLEEMVVALDDDLRELGVSDLRVPKKVQAAASAFYGRLRVYDQALKSNQTADLAEALARNVPANADIPVSSNPLADHVRSIVLSLDGQTRARLANGTVTFPTPGGIA